MVKRNRRWEEMDKSKIDLSLLRRQFEVFNKSEGKSPRTVEWYDEVVRLFYEWLVSEGHPTTLEFLGEMEAREFIIHVQEKPGTKGPRMSSHSVANRVRAIRTFYGWLYERGYTEEHLLEGLKIPKTEEIFIEPLTRDEIGQIFSAINPNTAIGARNTAIVSLLLDAGLRVSELVNLENENVHLEQRYVKVYGKGSKERVVSFGVACQKAIMHYYHYFRGEPAHPGVTEFFLSIDAQRMTPSSLKSLVKRLAKSSGVGRLHPHLMRHTYATMFLLNGGDVFLLQQNLGHTTLEMVNHYVHIASRMAAVVSQSFSPLDRMNVRDNRRFRHGFVQTNGMNGHIYPNVGSKRQKGKRRNSKR